MDCFTRSELSMLRILAEALTFDDVSLVPAHSSVLPNSVRLATQLTRNGRFLVTRLGECLFDN
jgi:IMP dehydrogenase/GMP reductase